MNLESIQLRFQRRVSVPDANQDIRNDMATNSDWHAKITAQLGGAENYGKGIWPNPFISENPNWTRQKLYAKEIEAITRKIESLFEPRFITVPEISEVIAAIITMTDARRILEVGTCTGYTTLHILRAIIGKQGAKVVSVDPRPAFDSDFFASCRPWCEMVNGWSPQIFETMRGQCFDAVFVDSDHSLEHTQLEWEALQPITRKGTIFFFHDVPEWQTPAKHEPPPVRTWLESLVTDGTLRGLCLPSCEQLDCREEYGAGYPVQCNPGLGIFVRNK